MHGMLVCFLCLLPFDMLVQADVVLACIRIGFEVAAFVALRYIEPIATRDAGVYMVWIGTVTGGSVLASEGCILPVFVCRYQAVGLVLSP